MFAVEPSTYVVVQALFCSGSKFWHWLLFVRTVPAPSPAREIARLAKGALAALKVAVTSAAAVIVKKHVDKPQAAAGPVPAENLPGVLPRGTFPSSRIAVPGVISNVHVEPGAPLQTPPPPRTPTAPELGPTI